MRQRYEYKKAVLDLQLAADTADIVHIEVPEAQRRCGIATQLLLESMEKIKKQGVKELFLEVREHNLPAIRLYEKIGAVRTGLRKNYYKNPQENALVYKITL